LNRNNEKGTEKNEKELKLVNNMNGSPSKLAKNGRLKGE
jgi:hypothetical protein